MRISVLIIITLFSASLTGCSNRFWETTCGFLPRPQHPNERPYIIREVTVDGGSPGVKLAGELTFPEGQGPFPSIVLISGSALVDRDSKILGHKPFLVLADYLTRNGYAVFRHDDRGYGKSTGDSYSALDTDFAADAAAALRWLRTQEHIDTNRSGFIGHSQGGFKAPLALQIERPDFMIFLAGGVEPMAVTLLRQADDRGKAAGLLKTDRQRQERELRTIFEILRSSGTVEEANNRIVTFALKEGASRRQASKLASDYATPWMMAELKRGDDMYAEIDREMADLIKAYNGPLLVFYAEKDLLVSAAVNAPLTEPLLSHPASKVITFPGLNHFFQPAKKGGIEEMCEIETTMEPSVLETIVRWLDQAIPIEAGVVSDT